MFDETQTLGRDLADNAISEVVQSLIFKDRFLDNAAKTKRKALKR